MRKVTEQGFRSVSLKLYANLRIYALKSFFFYSGHTAGSQFPDQGIRPGSQQ